MTSQVRPALSSHSSTFITSEPRRLLSGLAALGLAFAGQSRLSDRTPDLPAALALFVVAALVGRYALPMAASASWTGHGSWPSPKRYLAALPSAAVTIGLAVSSLVAFDGTSNSGQGWLLYVLALVGTLVTARTLPGGSSSHSIPRVGKAELLVLAALTAGGLWLRLHEIATLPFGDWFDEAVHGLAVERILSDPSYRPVFFAEFPQPAMFLYPFALGRLLFGYGPASLRIVTAIAGTAAIPVMFLLVRRLFGSPRIALVASALLAFSSWHVTFSRFPVPAPFSITLDICVVYFLAKAIQERSPRSFLVSGIAFGLDINFYSASRFLFAAIAGLGLFELFRRRKLHRSWVEATLLFSFGLSVAAGPLAQYAIGHPVEFNGRAVQVSILPEIERSGDLMPLRDNLVKHLLMFNDQGDPNGRHNVPGEPMFDFVGAALLALGFGIALLQSNQTSYFLLVAWIGLGLIPGVLTLSFEAPQSLRSFGAVVPALVLAAVPLGGLWDRWTRTPLGAFGWLRSRAAPAGQPMGLQELFVGTTTVREGGRWRGPGAADRFLRAAGPALLLVLVASSCFLNYRKYFVTWANDFGAWSAHSTAETIVGLRLRELGVDDDVYASQFFADSPPTIRFLAPSAPRMKLFDRALSLPVQSAARRVVVFLDPQEDVASTQLHKYYPAAVHEQISAPFGSAPVVKVVTLSQDDIASVQGIEARYSAGSELKTRPDLTRRERTLEVEPASLGLGFPVAGEWSAVLQAGEFGDYAFNLSGPLGSELFIDGTKVFGDGGSTRLRLAQGNHALRVRSVFYDAGSQLRLTWQQPGGLVGPIPPNRFYLPPIAATGLLGRYYRSEIPTGEPAFMRIDPQIGSYFHILPLPRPYSAEWTGSLFAPAAGTYRLGTESISSSQLFVDGRLAIDSQEPGRLSEVDVLLTAGKHDVRLLFIDRDSYSRVYLYWTPPGRGREVIPTEYLLPPQGTDLPGGESYAIPTEGLPPPGPSIEIRAPVGTVRFPPEKLSTIGLETLFGGVGRLAEPRDAAFDSDGNLYVVDSVLKRVVAFKPTGELLGEFGGPGVGDGRFEDPVAIVISSKDELYVLDAASGLVHRFDRTGRFLGRFAGDKDGLYRPRGIAIDSSDVVFVVDTGQNRILKYGRSGELLAIVGGVKGSGAGQLLEPTDALPLESGDLVVVDTGNKRLQWLDQTGRYRAEWPINWSVPLNGPHLARDGKGRFVITDPERGRILRYDIAGSVVTASLPNPASVFRLPVGIASDSSGNIYVVDTGAGKVAKISLGD